MKLSVCELECEDSKHAGHAGVSAGSRCFSCCFICCRFYVTLSRLAVLDVDDSLTFTIKDT